MAKPRWATPLTILHSSRQGAVGSPLAGRGGYNRGSGGTRFVLVVGTIAALLASRSLVDVCPGFTKALDEFLRVADATPVAHGVLNDRQRQGDAAMSRGAIDFDLFLDREQLDQGQTRE